MDATADATPEMDGLLEPEGLSELVRALDRGEFVAYYQPQVRLEDGAIIGAEALLRWEHPQHGVIGPDRFIGALESSGLIVPVGLRMLWLACHEAHSWIQSGLGELSISVNLSARQFLEPDLVESVRAVLGDTGLRPRHLDLEITESMAIENMERARDIVYRLRGVGIQTAIDDFGTGHSSLSRLTEFPVSSLKIDRSFVADVDRDDDQHAIVASVVTLGHSLGLTVVAEGVETQEQLAVLRELECDVLQGYLFSRPVPAEEFRELLTSPLAGHSAWQGAA